MKPATNSLPRNSPCWCGSGKKFKKCHLGKDPIHSLSMNEKPIFSEKRIYIKTEEQIEGIRKSGQLTKKLLDMVEDRIGEGVTTNDLDNWVHTETLANGAIPAPLNYGHGQGKRRMPFPKSICTSPNDVICHGIPNNQALRNGDILNVDITCILDGYYGDASRMFIIGDVPEDTKKLVEVTHECLKLGIKQVFPSKRLGDIGHAIQKHAENNGFSVVRDFAGHGVGIEFHEAPQILHFGQPGKGEMLRENMVFTIEPMINMGSYECRILGDGWTAVTADGSLSAQWEHTLLVTKSGAEILTA
ncbi:MAG: type I methionyl aminopeptidase [Deltaproteobacteria bacterium]|nr:type I methionyl aminopeptidase [Deltaproteobacteria bacterium]